MLIEIHLLQNFAPSNLNRDETGSPKDAYFGGYRRSRVSSQCIKRRVRWDKDFREGLHAIFGNRSTMHARYVADRLMNDHGKPFEEAYNVGRFMFQKIGFKEAKNGNLTVMQFLGDDEITTIASAAAKNWDILAPFANAQLLWDRLATRLAGFLPELGEQAEMLGRLLADAKAGKANAATLQLWLNMPHESWEPLLTAVRGMPRVILAELTKLHEPTNPTETDVDEDEPNVPKKAAALLKDKKKNKDVAEALGKIEKPKLNDKTAERDADSKAATKVLKGIFDPLQKSTTTAVDIALFGRMVAEVKDEKMKVHAACQVAHAISTNKLASMESDYFTAVDDLKALAESQGIAQDAGAGMIGTVEFNSACFYRYANLDIGQLSTNLQGDAELTKKTAGAFLKAFVHAIPTGKQNTFAAQNPPSLVFAVVRTGGPVSLTNAFVKPVTPRGEQSLVEESITALDKYYGQIVKMYGQGGLTASAVCLLDDVTISNLKTKKDSVDEVIGVAIEAAFPGGAA